MFESITNRCFRFSSPLLFLIIFLSSFTVFGQETQIPETNKNLPQFHRINDHFLRGGQPNKEGFQKLAQMGVKVIIDLRKEGDDRANKESQLVTSLGMRYVNLTVSTFLKPDEKQIQRFIALIHENENQPVFIHCTLGKDRTGIMSAIYRVEFDHWTADKAYQEMIENGLTIPILRTGMKKYLYEYAKRKNTQEETHSDPVVNSQTVPQ